MTQFKQKPSASYLRALRALEELAEEEGSDAVRRACADATWEDNKKSFVKSKGLREAKSQSIERLIGKHSKSLLESPSPAVLPGDDHPSLWLKNGKPHVYISQPYELSIEDLKELVEFCERHSLNLHVSTWPAWHFPGSVLNVKVTKKSD